MGGGGIRASLLCSQPGSWPRGCCRAWLLCWETRAGAGTCLEQCWAVRWLLLGLWLHFGLWVIRDTAAALLPQHSSGGCKGEAGTERQISDFFLPSPGSAAVLPLCWEPKGAAQCLLDQHRPSGRHSWTLCLLKGTWEGDSIPSVTHLQAACARGWGDPFAKLSIQCCKDEASVASCPAWGAGMGLWGWASVGSSSTSLLRVHRAHNPFLCWIFFLLLGSHWCHCGFRTPGCISFLPSFTQGSSVQAEPLLCVLLLHKFLWGAKLSP